MNEEINKEMYEFTATLKAETELAIRIFDGGRFHWLPKSQIEYDKGLDKQVEISCPEWLAKEKGII